MAPQLPAHVANAFLARAARDCVPVTHLKLQKLVYFLHGWYLATQNEPAIGEQFEAWPYGPVLSSLYHEFKKYGSNSITGYASEIDPATGEYKALMVSPENKTFYDVFDRVWDRYKNQSALALSSLTHRTGSPWFNARQRGVPYISNQEIQAHFRELATPK